MHFGPGTASDIVMRVKDVVHLLPADQTARDLGVSFTSNLKSSEQTDKVVMRARGVLFMMQRGFSRLTPAIFLPAYCALVRPLWLFLTAHIGLLHRLRRRSIRSIDSHIGR